jgi:hypothetical protein
MARDLVEMCKIQCHTMMHGYSILERVPVPGTDTRMVLSWYAPKPYQIFFFFFHTGYATGTRGVHPRVHQTQKNAFFFFSFLLRKNKISIEGAKKM